jgi:hypothetical protein
VFAAGHPARACAAGAQPNSVMTVWSLGAHEGAAPLRYGDAILLQVRRCAVGSFNNDHINLCSGLCVQAEHTV